MEGTLRRPHPPELRLIETFRREAGGGFRRLDAHLARMAAAASALGFAFTREAVELALARVEGAGDLRVRLTLARDGSVEVTAAPLAPGRPVWALVLAAERLRSSDPWLRLKSSVRQAHDAARAALPPDVDEALLMNERGELCEGTITTLFLDRGEGLLTPPLAAGLLPGVLRGELLARGEAREAVLYPEDLGRGRIFLGNSLRGLVPAALRARM